MYVRDAVEADAGSISSFSGQPADAVRNTIHDRSVRVAVTDEVADRDSEADDPSDPIGYVAFDARPDTVYVTGFGGDQEAINQLLQEPISFATAEGMPVEALVEVDDGQSRSAIEDVGFAEDGPGPRFEGKPTVRYRYQPPS